VIALHALDIGDKARDLARRFRLGRTEDRDDAVIDRSAALAIAAASSLGNLIEACLGTPDAGEIEIDAGFNEAGGDQTTGPSIL
jgi:hypothetical protein